MDHFIVMCRSLTFAQRAVRLLERGNIPARLVKAPQGVTPEGCSYGVRIRPKDMKKSLALIAEAGIKVGRIYRVDSKGKAAEVER